MKIGIVVHSKTGNTRSVAEKLQEKLAKSGHEVRLESIEVAGDGRSNSRQFRLANCPDIGAYDYVIFGAPVWGATVSSVMAAYLKQLSTLKGKRVLCFVTMLFPFSWMGGTSAIAKMRTVSETKGADICGTGIVRWSGRGREERIAAMVSEFTQVIGSF